MNSGRPSKTEKDVIGKTGGTPKTPETGADVLIVEQADMIRLKFQGQSGEEFCYMIKRTMRLGNAVQAYRHDAKIPDLRLRLHFDDHRISPDETPELLGLKDDDVVEVYAEQIGGA